MALTEIEMVRLEIGCDVTLMSDSEIEYFLTKNQNSIPRTSQDVARALLFQLAQLTRYKAAELEDYQSDYFKNYMAALKLYLSDANYNIALKSSLPYAGGISRSDIQANLDTIDNNVVAIEKGIPTDYEGVNVNNDSAFSDYDFSTGNKFPRTPFSV